MNMTIDVSDGTAVTLNPISGTVYQIPENLSVGTYNIQVHETTTEGFSTFSSAFIFIQVLPFWKCIFRNCLCWS